MKSQRRFAPTGGEFAPELVARFIGIRSVDKMTENCSVKLTQAKNKIKVFQEKEWWN